MRSLSQLTRFEVQKGTYKKKSFLVIHSFSILALCLPWHTLFKKANPRINRPVSPICSRWFMFQHENDLWHSAEKTKNNHLVALPPKPPVSSADMTPFLFNRNLSSFIFHTEPERRTKIFVRVSRKKRLSEKILREAWRAFVDWIEGFQVQSTLQWKLRLFPMPKCACCIYGRVDKTAQSIIEKWNETLPRIVTNRNSR